MIVMFPLSLVGIFSVTILPSDCINTRLSFQTIHGLLGYAHEAMSSGAFFIFVVSTFSEGILAFFSTLLLQVGVGTWHYTR